MIASANVVCATRAERPSQDPEGVACGIDYPSAMSAALVESSIVSRSDGWLSAWVGDEHVMMSADTGTCISLTETGGRIWELIEQPIEVHALCAGLNAEFEADSAVLRDDVFEFLGRLRDERAIVVA